MSEINLHREKNNSSNNAKDSGLNLYFDNAATSYPKPKALEDAAIKALRRGGNYGRSSYGRSVENVRVVELCRDELANFIGVDADNLCFTKNATEASNIILSALNLKGEKVLVSPLEHNAVMRPLTAAGAEIEVLEHYSDGLIDIEAFTNREFSNVELICINHAGSVNGVIQPLSQIIEITTAHNIKLFVDATQAVGALHNSNSTNPYYATSSYNYSDIDYLIFTGHKSLYGPVGTGAFYIKEPKNIPPYLFGGTGSNSDSYNMPYFLPDKFEAGTPNIIGIEMLLAALQNRPKPNHTRVEFRQLIERLKEIETLELFIANDFNNQIELFSIRGNNISIGEFTQKLWDNYKIEVRKGLHCAPLAHRSIGTYKEGTIRFSLSPYHTKEDLEYLYNAIETISNSVK